MLSTAPRAAFRCGAAAWARKNGARAFTANSPSHCAGVIWPNGTGKNAAALFTSASSRPKRPTALATSSGRRSNCMRSACSTSVLPGRAASSSAASASASPRERWQCSATS